MASNYTEQDADVYKTVHGRKSAGRTVTETSQAVGVILANSSVWIRSQCVSVARHVPSLMTTGLNAKFEASLYGVDSNQRCYTAEHFIRMIRAANSADLLWGFATSGKEKGRYGVWL